MVIDGDLAGGLGMEPLKLVEGLSCPAWWEHGMSWGELRERASSGPEITGSRVDFPWSFILGSH